MAEPTTDPPLYRSAAEGRGRSRCGARLRGRTTPRRRGSVSLDGDCAQLLEELARAAHVAVSALAVAAIQAGLPAHSDEAQMAIVDERVARAGVLAARVERNFRLPEQLRTRVDELVAAAREHLPRVNLSLIHI